MNKTKLKTNEEWKFWGEFDPLYGVLSDPQKQRGSATPWQEEDFLKVGEEHWKALWPQWKSYGVSTESCVEIGCGVGRMTRQLASVFKRVYAVDVSEGMIQIAKAHSTPNVEFHLTNGIEIPVPDESVTAAFSMHVLQHLDSKAVQLEYIRRIHSVLKPGATMLVHLPIYKLPFTGEKVRSVYSLIFLRNKLKNKIKRFLLRAGMHVHLQEFTEMPLQELFVEMSRIGFQNVELRFVPTHANSQIHPLVFGTKPLQSV